MRIKKSKHPQNLEGLEEFEKVLQKCEEWKDVTLARGPFTFERTSRSGKRVDFDYSERRGRLVIECGNSKGWQKLFADVPKKVSLMNMLSSACFALRKAEIDVETRKLNICRRGIINCDELEKAIGELILASRTPEPPEEEFMEEVHAGPAVPSTLCPPVEQTLVAEKKESKKDEKIPQKLSTLKKKEWEAAWYCLQEIFKNKPKAEGKNGWLVGNLSALICGELNLVLNSQVWNFITALKKKGLLEKVKGSNFWLMRDQPWSEAAPPPKAEKTRRKPAPSPLKAKPQAPAPKKPEAEPEAEKAVLKAPLEAAAFLDILFDSAQQGRQIQGLVQGLLGKMNLPELEKMIQEVAGKCRESVGILQRIQQTLEAYGNFRKLSQ